MIYLAATNVLFLMRYYLMRMGTLRDQIYVPVLLGLFLVSAFRYEVGCDWSGYYFQYLRAESWSWSEAIETREPVWWWILHQLRTFEIPYPWINVASSAIFFFGIHVLAKRQPDRLAFLILLFPILIINMPMSAIRQGAAIGIMCLAFAAFMDKRLLRFLAFTLLAATLHSSALIFLLLAPLVMGQYTKTRLAFAAMLSMPGVLLLLDSSIAELISDRYIENDRDAAGAAFRAGVLFISGLFFFVFLRIAWRRDFPEDYSLASVGSMLMLVMLALVPISSVIGDRFGYYLIPIQTMIFARLPYLSIEANRRFFIAAPYIGLILLFAVWTSISRHFQICYLPYQTWLFGYPDTAWLF